MWGALVTRRANLFLLAATPFINLWSNIWLRKTMATILLFLSLVLPLIDAQTVHWGPCPTPMVQPNFDLNQVQSIISPLFVLCLITY